MKMTKSSLLFILSDLLSEDLKIQFPVLKPSDKLQDINIKAIDLVNGIEVNVHTKGTVKHSDEITEFYEIDLSGEEIKHATQD